MSASCSSPAAASTAHKPRKTARKKTYLSGMIVSLDGVQSLACTVRDLSERGARIAVSQGAAFPPRFYLLTSRQPVSHESRIIWRNATQAGVKFVTKHRLSPELSAPLLSLWRLYLELCPRGTNPFDF